MSNRLKMTGKNSKLVGKVSLCQLTFPILAIILLNIDGEQGRARSELIIRTVSGQWGGVEPPPPAGHLGGGELVVKPTSRKVGFCRLKGGDAYQESEIRAVKTTQNNKNESWRREMKKRILSLVVVLALLGALVPATVFAATTGTVSCTVTAVLVAVEVTDGDVDYGTLALGATKNTAKVDETHNPDGMDTPQTQVVKNTGTVHENFQIKTSNAARLRARTRSRMHLV
jgi:hypothetical protein